MRKILTKIICAVLMVCLLCSGLVGCGSWKNEDLKAKLDGAGALVQDGGFVAETANYVYFINGLGDSTADNTLGAPLKGALLVAKKTDLTNAEVVVPKLFVATDINAGLFIDIEEGYVYYGTPSTEKNSSGAIAKEDITFMRTKLDGSGDTDVYFTKENALGLEYRIVKGADGVCIYYYESENSAIVCYNTATKTATDIITTDEKTDKKVGDEYISLSNYYFLDNDGSNGIIAVLTATVYTEAYDEAKAEASSSYSRITANYNKVYAIKAGENKLTKVVSGKKGATTDEKYQIILVDDQYLFYEQTTATNNVETYAVTMDKLADLGNRERATKIVNAEYVDASNVIVSLNEVYVIGESKVYKTTLLAKDGLTKEPICLASEISQPLYVKDNFFYFYDSASNLARMNVATGSDYKIVRVSEGAVATMWFFPEFITVSGKQYLVYAENTTTGQNYLRYLNITDITADSVKTEEDDDTKYYLDVEIKDLCQRTDADKAKLIDAKANAITELIPTAGVTSEEIKEGSDLLKAINEFNTLYNGATEEVKELVSEDSVALVEKYERVVKIAKLYTTLAGVEKFNTQAQADASNIKTKYQDSKTALVEFKNADDREDIDALISTNLKAYYTIAVKWYEAK